MTGFLAFIFSTMGVTTSQQSEDTNSRMSHPPTLTSSRSAIMPDGIGALRWMVQ